MRRRSLDFLLFNCESILGRIESSECITYYNMFYIRMLLRYSFEQMRSSQVAIVHCNAQTSPQHVIQKLAQTCMVISTNTGRVYRPKDCERLVLYLKDINLPKPDKWGTSQLTAFLQQVAIVSLIYLCYCLERIISQSVIVFQLLTYNGFYDSNLEFVGLEGVQIVSSMNAGNSVGRHKLTTRLSSIVRICSIGYVCGPNVLGM